VKLPNEPILKFSKLLYDKYLRKKRRFCLAKSNPKTPVGGWARDCLTCGNSGPLQPFNPSTKYGQSSQVKVSPVQSSHFPKKIYFL